MMTIWDNYKSVVFYLQGAGPEGAGGAVPSLGQPKERGDYTIWRNYQLLPGDPDRTGQDFWYEPSFVTWHFGIFLFLHQRKM